MTHLVTEKRKIDYPNNHEARLTALFAGLCAALGAPSAGGIDQLECADQNESYVNAWLCAPKAAGEPDPGGGMLTGNGELDTYAFDRYAAEECAEWPGLCARCAKW